jgi:hypothetical protein
MAQEATFSDVSLVFTLHKMIDLLQEPPYTVLAYYMRAYPLIML